MIKFSPSLSEALTYLDGSPGRTFTSDTLVSHTSFWSYTFFEGDIPTDEWLENFRSAKDTFDARLMKSTYNSQLGKEIASIVFNAPLHRSSVLPERKSISSSGSANFLNRFVFATEGTPNWFMLCQYDNSPSDFNIGYNSKLAVLGSIGVNGDLYITKSPITQYSEITLSDISIDHRFKD